MEPRESNNGGLWTAEEVAEYLKVSKGTVDQWAKAGRVPVVKVGTLNRFRPEDIEQWVADRLQPVETKGA